MANNGPFFFQPSRLAELTDLEGVTSSDSYHVFEELMYKPSELPPLPFFVDDVPSLPITPLPPALPLVTTPTETESIQEPAKGRKEKKRKWQDDAVYQEEIENFRRLTRDTKEDQANFKKVQELMLKSLTEKLIPEQFDELRALRNMYSARASRAKKIEEKASLEATRKDLTEENKRLKNDNASLRQRMAELEAKLTLFQEDTIERLLRTQVPQVLEQYYTSFQTSNLRSLSASTAPAGSAVRAQADRASLKPV